MTQSMILVGVVPGTSHENRYRKGAIITFVAASPARSEPMIGFYEGPHSHAAGSTAPAGFWLKSRPYISDTSGGKLTAREAPEGWFERVCREADCAWFLPIVQRLASGENVAASDVKAVYAADFPGRDLPEGTVRELFEIIRHQHPMPNGT